MRVAGIGVLAAILALGLTALTPGFATAGDDNVVVTRPGVVFHKVGGDDIRGRGYVKVVDAAIEAGYTPCRACFGKELGSIPSYTPELGTGAAVAAFGLDGVPAAPASAVSQPFGIRLVSTRSKAGGLRGGVRNPYLNYRRSTTLVFEQGAYQ